MSIKSCPADIAFSQAVRLNQGFSCERCKVSGGKVGSGLPKMECAHIFGRRHKSVRWDTMNALCLCHTCHRYFTENPLDFTAWLQEYLGQSYLDILNEKRNGILKVTKAVRAEIAKHYRAEVKRLESGGDNLVSWA